MQSFKLAVMFAPIAAAGLAAIPASASDPTDHLGATPWGLAGGASATQSQVIWNDTRCEAFDFTVTSIRQLVAEDTLTLYSDTGCETAVASIAPGEEDVDLGSQYAAYSTS